MGRAVRELRQRHLGRRLCEGVGAVDVSDAQVDGELVELGGPRAGAKGGRGGRRDVLVLEAGCRARDGRG